MKELIAYLVVTSVLNLLLSRRSQIDAWCESRPYLSAAMKVLRAIGFDPWALVQGATLATKKRLPLALRPTLPPPAPLPAPLPMFPEDPTQ